MFSLVPQSRVSLPVHIFWFPGEGFYQVVTTSHFNPNFSCFPHEPVSLTLLLACIGEVMAMATTKILTSIHNSYPPVTLRTAKPLPAPSKVAWGPGEVYRIFNALPFTIKMFVPVYENKSVIFDTIADTTCFLSATFPRHRPSRPRHEQLIFFIHRISIINWLSVVLIASHLCPEP